MIAALTHLLAHQQMAMGMIGATLVGSRPGQFDRLVVLRLPIAGSRCRACCRRRPTRRSRWRLKPPAVAPRFEGIAA
jgi:hypothetical protein